MESIEILHVSEFHPAGIQPAYSERSFEKSPGTSPSYHFVIMSLSTRFSKRHAQSLTIDEIANDRASSRQRFESVTSASGIDSSENAFENDGSNASGNHENIPSRNDAFGNDASGSDASGNDKNDLAGNDASKSDTSGNNENDLAGNDASGNDPSESDASGNDENYPVENDAS